MQIDADRIRREREQRAWSQEQLAHVTGLGVRTIQRIESSGIASSESTLALASVFELPVDELAVEREPRDRKLVRDRIVSSIAVAFSLATAVFFARFALAEQIQVDVGVNIDGGVQVSRSIVADEGQDVELEFENQLKTVITPGLISIDDREMVSVSLQIFERDENGKYSLLESPDLVHQDGGDWEIKLSGTPSGKLYRLVVRPYRIPS